MAWWIFSFIYYGLFVRRFYFAGTLKLNILTSAQRMRWSLAAHDVCYTNKLHGYFFLLGKSIPIVRGNGIYQVS